MAAKQTDETPAAPVVEVEQVETVADATQVADETVEQVEQAPASVDDLLDDILNAKDREPAYRVDERYPVVEVGDGTFVARGVRSMPNGAKVTALLLINGNKQQSFPLKAIIRARLGDGQNAPCLTDAEDDAIRAKRSALKK